MSIACMMHVWWNSPSSGNDRLVLLAIADEADDEGRNAFPSVRRLADKINAHSATVLRSVVKLEKAGELEVLRPEVKGRGRFNKYRVVMQPVPSASELRARYAPDLVDNNGRNVQRIEKIPSNEVRKRSQPSLEMVAPMRADPKTPEIDPRKKRSFPQDGHQRMPEPRPFCEECDKWTDGEGYRELQCQCNAATVN